MTGSVALALHGRSVQCRDLDILTRAQDADLVASALPGRVVEPVEFRNRPSLRGRIGRKRVQDVDVEILGGVQNKLPDGSWTPPPAFGPGEIIHIQIDDCKCPVLALPQLRAAYEAMNRNDRIELIERRAISRRESATDL